MKNMGSVELLVVGVILFVSFCAIFVAYQVGHDCGYSEGYEFYNQDKDNFVFVQEHSSTKIFHEFQSEDELIAWLEQNNVSDRKWVNETYECDKFSEDLMIDAFYDGYIIFSTAGNVLEMNDLETYGCRRYDVLPEFPDKQIFFRENLNTHAWNYCFIDGFMYWIEPQADEIYNSTLRQR